MKNEGTNIHKASKTVINPNNGDIKSVIVGHPKTASNLLNPRTQSDIITQELETVEKPNIFDIESVIIEYPKNVTKLSKPIKQQKIITQQPNKTKVYTESADRTLQLDLIKRHILPKKCSQNYEIKFVNSTKYHEKHNLARSYI